MNNPPNSPRASVNPIGPCQFYVLHDVNFVHDYLHEISESRLSGHTIDDSSDDESLEAEKETHESNNESNGEPHSEAETEGSRLNSVANICEVVCGGSKKDRANQRKSNINMLLSKLDNLLPTGKKARKTKRSILWSACKFVNRAQKFERRLSSCRRSKICLRKKMSAMKKKETIMGDEIQRLLKIVERYESKTISEKETIASETKNPSDSENITENENISDHEKISEKELMTQNCTLKAIKEISAKAINHVKSPMNMDRKATIKDEKEICVSNS